MDDLIYRGKLQASLCKACGKCQQIYDHGGDPMPCWIYNLIENQPAIEAEPVRHGEWHECWHTDTVCASICTNCGKAATQARHIVGQEIMTNVRYPLCPYCGGHMKSDRGE